MAHTCHHRYAHLHVIRFTWTPSLPWLPSLYMSLPLVPSPGVIVSVSVLYLCVVRVPYFVLCSVYLLKHSLPELSGHSLKTLPLSEWMNEWMNEIHCGEGFVFYCNYKGLVRAGWLLGKVFTHYNILMNIWCFILLALLKALQNAQTFKTYSHSNLSPTPFIFHGTL